MKLSERVKKMSKLQQIIITIVVIILIIVCGMGYEAYSEQKRLEQGISFIKNKEKEIRSLTKKIEESYIDEKNKFMKKDLSMEKLSNYRKELEKLGEEFKNENLHEDVETWEYETDYSICEIDLVILEKLLEKQNEVNSLFSETAIEGDNVNTDIAIRSDLTFVALKIVKDKCYQEGSMKEWNKAINSLLLSAENQLKQIDKAKQTLELVFKDDKVINTEQEKYNNAKIEIDKVKNEKIKKGLTDKLAKVKQEIDSKAKAESEKKTQEQAIVDQTEQKIQEQLPQEQASQITQNESPVNDTTPQQEEYSPYVSKQEVGGSSSAGNSNGSTGGGAVGSGSISGGGQTSGNQNNSTPVQPIKPNEPSTPSGPPAGWIVPPYAIGSAELMNWIADNGYSGYDSADGYICPY